MNRSLLYGMGIGVLAMAIVVLLLGGVFVGPRATPSPSARPSVSPRPSASVRPSPTPLDTAIRAAAVVVPQRSADLSLPVSGIVDQVLVKELDEVTIGQLLVRLDQSTYQAAINLAQDELDRAEAALEQAQIDVDRLPDDASPEQVEKVQVALRLAEAERNVAESTLAEAEVELRQTELRAPFNGTVAAIDIERGEQALAGQPVVTIGDLSAWLIETTDLSELEVVRVAVGATATVTFEALPDLVLSGHVDRIQVKGTGDAGNVVFAVAIRPDEHSEQLRWNMTATVRITPSD
jgi:RND family efflux transporter MFP subunit